MHKAIPQHRDTKKRKMKQLIAHAHRFFFLLLTVRTCQSSGIMVRMVTGDNPLTARQIATVLPY